MDDMFQQILHFLNQPITSWLSGEVIFLWAMGQWLVWRLGILLPVRAMLADGIHVLTNLDVRDFSDRLPQLDGEFAKNELLSQPWRRYRQGLRISDRWVESLHEPESFFSVDALLQGHMDLRFYRLLPYYLLGVGVLISLAGFISGLFFAPLTLAPLDQPPLDVADLRNHPWEATALFLKSFSYKLFPAFAGLLAGLLFSYGHRLQMDLLTAYARQFRRLLSDRVQSVRFEVNSTASERFEEDFRALMDPQGMAQEIASHLDGTVGSVKKEIFTLGEKIRESLVSGQVDLGPVLEAIRRQGEQLGRWQTEAVQRVLEAESRWMETKGEGFSLDAVMTAVRREGDRIVSRHESMVRVALEEAVGGLRDSLGGQLDRMVAGVRSDTGTLERSLRETLPVADKLLEPVLEALRHQGRQLAEGHAGVVSKLLEGMATHAEVTGFGLESVQSAVALQSRQLAQRQQDGFDALLKEMRSGFSQAAQSQEILEGIREENRILMGQFRQHLATVRISLDPVLVAMDEQGEKWARQHREAIQEALSAVAVKGAGGELELQPLVAAVRAEGQRLGLQHESALKEILDQRFSPKVFMQAVREALAGFSSEWYQELSTLRQSLDPLLATFQTQGRQMAERHATIIRDSLAQIMAEKTVLAGEGVSGLQPVLEALRDEGKTIVRRQGEALAQALAGMTVQLRESLNPEVLIRSIRTDMSALMEQFQERNQHQMDLYGRTLQGALGGLTVAGTDGNVRLEPVLAAIRLEGERGVARQSEAMRSAMEDMARVFRDSFSSGLMVEGIREENRGMLREMRASLEVVPVSLDPIWKALSELEQRVSRHYAVTVAEASRGVVVAGDGDASVLEAVRLEGRRILAAQKEALGDVVRMLEDGLRSGFSTENVIRAVVVEAQSLAEKMEAQGRMWAQEKAEWRRERADSGSEVAAPVMGDILAALKGEQEKWMGLIDARLGQGEGQWRRSLEALESRSAAMLASHAASLQNLFGRLLPMVEPGEERVQTVLAAVRAEGERILVRQGENVRMAVDGVVARFKDTLAPDVIIQGVQGEMRLLVGQMQQQGEDVLKRQTRMIETALTGLEARVLADDPALQTLLADVRQEGERLLKRQEGILNQALSGIWTGESIQEAIRAEHVRLEESLRENMAEVKSSLVALLAALDAQGERLAREHSRAIGEAFASITLRDDNGQMQMEPVLVAIKVEGERMLARQEALVESALDKRLSGDALLALLQGGQEGLLQRFAATTAAREDKMAGVFQGLRSQGEALAARLAEAVGAIEESILNRGGQVDARLAEILKSVREEGGRIVARQGDTLRLALDGVEVGLKEMLSPQAVMQAVRGELNPVARRLEEQATRLARSHMEAMDAAVSRLTVDLGVGGESTQTLVAEVRRQGEALVVRQRENLERLLAERLPETVASAVTPGVLETLEGRIKDALQSGDLWLQRVLESVAGLEESLVRRQAGVIMDSLRDVAVRGDAGGGVSLEPVLVAVRAEGERVLAAVEENYALPRLLEEIRGEFGRWAERLAADIHGDAAVLAPVLAALQGQARQLAEGHVAIEESIKGLAGKKLDAADIVGPVVEAIRGQEAGVRQALEEWSFADTLIDTLRAGHESMELRLRELPAHHEAWSNRVMAALQSQGTLLAQRHSQALAEALADIAVKGDDGVNRLEPVLALVKAEGERILSRQGELVRVALAENFSLAPILATIRDEHTRLVEQLRIDGEGDAEVVQPILSALKAQGQALLEGHTAIQESLQELRGISVDAIVDPVVAALQAQEVRILERGQEGVRGVLEAWPFADTLIDTLRAGHESMELRLRELPASNEQWFKRVTEVLRVQGEDLAQRHAQVMAQALADVAVKGDDGVNRLEPVLALVKAEGERILSRQGELVRVALEEKFSLDAILATIRAEHAHLIEQWSQNARGDETILNSVLAELKDQGQQLLADHSAVQEALQGLAGTGFNPDLVETALRTEGKRIVEAVREGMRQLVEDRGGRNLLNSILAGQEELRQSLRENQLGTEKLVKPIIDAMKVQGQMQMAQYTRAIGEVLENVAVRDHDGRLQVEPLLAAVKAEGERTLSRQGEMIGKAMEGAVAAIFEMVAPNAVLDAVRSEVTVFGRRLEGIEDRLLQRYTQSVVGTMTEWTAQWEDKGLAGDSVVVAIKGEVENLFSRQLSEVRLLLEGGFSRLKVMETAASLPMVVDDRPQTGLNLTPILEEVKNQGQQLIQHQTQVMEEILARWQAAGGDAGDREALVTRLLGEMAQLMDRHDDRVRRALEDLEGRLPESMGADAGLQGLMGEMDRLHVAFSEGIRRLDFSLDPVFDALEKQSDALAERMTLQIHETLEKVGTQGGEHGLTLDPVLAAIRGEGEWFFSRQQATIQQAMDAAVSNLGAVFSSHPVMEALYNRQKDISEHVTAEIQRMVDPLVVAVAAQGTLVPQQLRAIENALSDHLEVGMASLVSSMEQESARLLDTQRGVMRQTLEELTARLGEKLSSDRLVAAMRDDLPSSQQNSVVGSESSGSAMAQAVLDGLQRLMVDLDSRQDDQTARILSGLAVLLSESFSPTFLAQTLQEEMQRLGAREERSYDDLMEQMQKSLTQITESVEQRFRQLGDELHGRLDLAMVEVGSRQEGAGQNPERLLPLLRGEITRVTDAHGHMLRESFSAMLHEATGMLSLQPILDAVAQVSQTLVQRLDAAMTGVLAQVRQERGDASGMDWGSVERQQKSWFDEHGRMVRDLLRETMEQWRAAQVSPDLLVDPVLAVVRQEGQHLLDQQEDMLAGRLGTLMDSLRGMISTDVVRQTMRQELADFGQTMLEKSSVGNPTSENLLTVFRDQVAAIVERQTVKISEWMQQAAHGVAGGDCLLETSLVEVLRGDVERLVQGQGVMLQGHLEELRTLITGVGDGPVATMPSEARDLVIMRGGEERFAAALLEPVLQTIRHEADLWSRTHGDVLRDVLADIKERFSSPVVALEPIFAAIDKGNEAILARLSHPQGVEALLKGFREENERFLERMEQQTPMVPLIEALQAQTDRLLRQQKEALDAGITRLLVGDGQAFPFEKIMQTLRDQSDRVVGQLSEGLALQPVLQILEGHLRELGENQFHTLHQALMAMTSSLTDGRLELEPVIAAVREEGARLSSRLVEQMSFTPILEALIEQGQRLVSAQTEVVEGALTRHFQESGLDAGKLAHQLEVHLDELRDTLSSQINPEPLMRMIREESRRLLESLPEGGVKEGILEGIEQSESRLLQRLSALVSPDRMVATVADAVDAVVGRHAVGLGDSLGRIEGQQARNVSLWQADLKQVRDDVGNDFAGRLRSELQQVREALHQGMEQVGNGLAGRLNSGLEEVRGRIVADVGGRLGEELEQQTGDLLTGMRAVLEEKADDMVSRMETAGSGAEVGLSRRVEEIMDGAQVMFSSLSQALVRQGDALEKVLTGLSGLGAQVDPKPALARMLAEIRELFGQQQGQFAEEVSSRLHAAQMEATAVGAIREEGERLLMAQGTALTQGFAEFLTRVNSAATPGEVAEVVRMQLTSFRGELGLRLQELSHGSSKAVTVVLETLGEEMRGRHAGMDVLLRRLLESQAVLADRPDWQPVLAEMRRDMEVWQGGQSERFAAMLTARLGDVATADVVVSALRGEGEKLLAVQSQVMQRGLDAILERIPSMAGIEDAVTAVDFLRSELAGLLASETHRLETLAARAATSMESVIVSARTQMTGIQDLGGEIRDLLDRQGRWFKETIAARLESSGMAARLVSAFKEESEILMEAQATRVDERLGALFADLEARFSSQDFVDVVRGETARLAEDFRRGLADVEVALSVANVDPVLRAMQEQTAHLQNNQQQELAPILEYMTQPVPATDWSPVREMVAGEIRRMLVSQSEVMQNISAGLVEINAGLAPDIQAMLTVLRGQVQSGLQAAVSQASASWSDMQAQSRRQTEARALEIQNTVIASVREQGAWLASEQKRILDEVVQTLARGEHSEVISLPAIQMALGEEFDRLAGILEQWFSSVVERIEATQGREVDLQVVVDAIRGEGLRLQEELHQHVSPQPVVDAIMAETNRLFMGHGEELGRKLEAILSSRAGLGVAATVGMEEEGDAGETMVDVVEDTWQDAGVVEEEPGSGVALALEVVDVPAVPETVATEVGAGMVPQGNDGSVFRAWVSGMVKDNDETTVADVPGQPVADKVVYTQRSHSKPTLGGSPWLGRLPSVGKVPTPTVREAGGGVVEGEKDGTVAPVVVDNRIRVVYPVFEGQAGDDTGEEKIHGALVSARKDWVRLIQAMQGSRQGEIDGQSLSDLLASMGRFLTNHFGREAAFLVAMSDDLCSRLRWGAAVSDPVIARLLDQFGHQSNAFMTSHDRDALEVMALDHGFQKAAGTLKGQISAISNRSVRSRSAKVFRSGGIVTDVAAPKEDVPEPVPAKPLESVFAQEIKAESVPKPVVAYVSMGGAVQRFADALRVRTTPREDATAKGAKRPSDEVVEQRASKKTEPAFSSVSKPVPVATRTVVGGSPFRKVEEVIEPKVEGSPITGKESQTRRLPEVSKALPENLAVPTSKTEMENRFFSAFLDRRREGQE